VISFSSLRWIAARSIPGSSWQIIAASAAICSGHELTTESAKHGVDSYEAEETLMNFGRLGRGHALAEATRH
jgi:hypothetical protein